jgi:4-hydroxy-3-methylbut-2-enyl diphosphate reductase
MQIILANPRGFCAGVERAIAIVERAIEKFGAPIYVRHEVVHNKFVCDDLRAKGASSSTTSPKSRRQHRHLQRPRRLESRVRGEAERAASRSSTPPARWSPRCISRSPACARKGREIVMIGHKGHPEVEGTMGQSADGMYLVEKPSPTSPAEVANPTRLAYVTQTTLSVDDAAQVVARCRSASPSHRRPEEGRHLLRDAEPPGCGQATGGSEVVLVVGSEEQLQLEPPARSRRFALPRELQG